MSERKRTNEERQREVDRQLAVMKAAIGEDNFFDSNSDSDSDSDDSAQLQERSNAVESARKFLWDEQEDDDDAVLLGGPFPKTSTKSAPMKVALGLGNQSGTNMANIWGSFRSGGAEQDDVDLKSPQTPRQSLSNLFLRGNRPSARRLVAPSLWNDADATEAEEFIQENSKRRFSYLACFWGTILWLIALGALSVFGYYIYDFAKDLRPAPAVAATAAEEHSEAIKLALMKNGVLTESVLDDPSSPQAAAFQWIKEDTLSTDKHQPFLAQRYALAVVYYSMNGQDWANSEGWLSEEGYCKWYGVQCLGTELVIEKHFDNGRVFDLALPSNQMKGTIPTELTTFKDLFFLNLQDNQLQGTIPNELGGWTGLRMFSIAHNELYGSIPPNLLSSSPDLRVLNAGFNGLTGTIPPEISIASNLRELHLEYNGLYGHIPDSVRDLDHLETMSLAGNKLGGTFPNGIFYMDRLETLYLHDNSLTGTLSHNFARFSHLELLTLNHNQLTGSVPNVFSQLRHLKEVHLHGNELSGNMAPSMCALRTEHKLSYLSVDCTKTDVEGEMGVHCECCTDCK